MESGDPNRKVIHRPWGSFVVGGYLATLLDDEEEPVDPLETGRMAWSLGPVADLFWLLVPESRELIADEAKDVLRSALRLGVPLYPLNDMSLTRDVMEDVLVPALEDVESHRDLFSRVLEMITRLVFDERTRDTWIMFDLAILTPLAEEHQQGALLSELAPDLMREIARLRAE